jgi:drug/metabolite transporter (DMT)-like permease
MNSREWISLVVLSVIWGSSFMFIKIGLRELSPFSLVFMRLCVALVFMMTFAKIMRLPFPVTLRQWGAIGFLGIINSALPFFLISWAQQFLDSATASILNATSPVFIMILAHLFTDDEKLTRRKVVGVGAGLAGIMVMVGPSLHKGIFLAGFAQLAILCGTLNYAFAALYVRRFRHLDSMMVTAVSLAGAALTAAVGLWFQPLPSFAQISAHTWFAVGMLGIFCPGIAYVIYFKVIASAGATNGMLVTLMIPVSALFMSSFFLGETIKINDIAGMLLIFSGLIIIDGRIFSVGSRLRHC